MLVANGGDESGMLSNVAYLFRIITNNHTTKYINNRNNTFNVNLKRHVTHTFLGEPKQSGCGAVNSYTIDWHALSCDTVLQGYICKKRP